jgi:hypothetical protein
MIQAFIFAIVFLLIGYEARACNEFAIRCDQSCLEDQDKASWVMGQQCFCGNPKDLKRSSLKLPRNFKGKSIIPEEAE